MDIEIECEGERKKERGRAVICSPRKKGILKKAEGKDNYIREKLSV